MRWTIGLAFAATIWAQPALDRPVAGRMLDREGALRTVTGVGGSFQVDRAEELRVVATACSRAVCLAKTESAIVSEAGRVDAPGGPAMIAIDGASAVMYFVATNQFARWREGALTPLEVAVDGEVLALRDTASGVNLAVRRGSGVWIVGGDGTILDSLPRETGAVLLLPDSVVYSAGDDLTVRRTDGTELRFTVTRVTALFALGDGYVEAMTPDEIYALRVATGREKLFVLPQAPGRARFAARR